MGYICLDPPLVHSFLVLISVFAFVYLAFSGIRRHRVFIKHAICWRSSFHFSAPPGCMRARARLRPHLCSHHALRSVPSVRRASRGPCRMPWHRSHSLIMHLTMPLHPPRAHTSAWVSPHTLHSLVTLASCRPHACRRRLRRACRWPQSMTLHQWWFIILYNLWLGLLLPPLH